jgi:hypothetical protein
MDRDTEGQGTGREENCEKRVEKGEEILVDYAPAGQMRLETDQ